MAAHTWNGISFGESTKVLSGDEQRAQVKQSFPGSNGTKIIDKGWRSRTFVISGRYSAATTDLVWAWFEAAWAMYNVSATFALYGSKEYQNCELKLRMVGNVGRKTGGGYVASYVATFTQLAPNSA